MIERTILCLAAFVLITACSSPGGRGPEAAHADPATREGACSILVGEDDLVQRTLELGHRSAGERDVSLLAHLQDRLFSVVLGKTHLLWAPAGELVDYLDDPDAYNRGAGTVPRVENAVARIRSVCGRD